MANKIPDQGEILPWEVHDSHDLEIGLGIDWLNQRMMLKFDRYVQTVFFTPDNLRELIASLSAQHALLVKGRPPGQ